jgi:uncharacterized protein with gpF-like domain
MSGSAAYMNLSFEAAIAFFRAKLNMPAATWDAIWGEMHTQAFTVAGAMTDDIIESFRIAVDRAISTGSTFADFKKDFDSIVEKTGWGFNGSAKWRAKVIYDTNLSVAYQRGHWQQMTDPDVVKTRPYLRYIRSSSAEPREEHLQWANLILPWDHPFWQSHYPPNGWECKCGVVSLSERQVQRLIDQGVNVQRTAPVIEYYDYEDKVRDRVIKVPKGIDPGWDYNVGIDGFRGAA